ncbi:MAG: hypothetical protein ACLSWS_10520, partial [Faecalispora jeddahensis]
MSVQSVFYHWPEHPIHPPSNPPKFPFTKESRRFKTTASYTQSMPLHPGKINLWAVGCGNLHRTGTSLQTTILNMKLCYHIFTCLTRKLFLFLCLFSTKYGILFYLRNLIKLRFLWLCRKRCVMRLLKISILASCGELTNEGRKVLLLFAGFHDNSTIKIHRRSRWYFKSGYNPP